MRAQVLCQGPDGSGAEEGAGGPAWKAAGTQPQEVLSWGPQVHGWDETRLSCLILETA